MQNPPLAHDAITPQDAALAQRLTLAAYPRSARYDPRWVLANLMGPNVLWLTEWLCQEIDLQPGMRVLDMGCGKAISSIFLAKEFGVYVWATDLWIEATENWQRVREAGLTDRVFPIHAEAHTLPFADGFFDAIVCLDAYHYFGTDDLYIGYFSQFVERGGQIGVVVPGLQQEFTDGLPEHLIPYWRWDFWTFHSPAWWHHHWQKSDKVAVERADFQQDGWRMWLLWLEVCHAEGYPSEEEVVEMLRADAGRNLGFTRIIARRS